MRSALESRMRRSAAPRAARVAALLASSAIAFAPAIAPAEIYRWTDEQGLERFSDRIENVPEAYRNDVTGALREDPAPGLQPTAPVVPDEPPSAPPELPDAPPVQLPDWSSRLLGLGAAAAFGAALGGVGLWLLLIAFSLRLGCRLVGEEVPGFGRALGVAAVQFLAGIAVGLVLGGAALLGLADPASAPFQGVQMLASLGVNALVIQAMLAQGFGRALAVALISLLVAVVVAVVVGIAVVFAVGGLVAG